MNDIQTFATKQEITSRTDEGAHQVEAHSTSLCLHCGQAVANGYTDFCCGGCEAIYRTIQGLGLSEFYHYRSIRAGNSGGPIKTKSSNYAPFDLEEIVRNALVSETGDLRTVSLLLSGVHCAGCLWLLERLPQVIPGIVHTKLQFAENRLLITYNKKALTLSQIARTLDSLGYPPEVPCAEDLLSTPSKARGESLLARLGVAGFCAANTMMLAVSLFEGLYTGIPNKYGDLFRYVSIALTLPVIFYSAVPFYRAAYTSMRLGRVHVDLPISLSIVLVFLLSCFNTVMGRAHVYFDSVCTLVFLLLIGRYLQGCALAKAQLASRRSWSVLPEVVRRIRDDKEELVTIRSIAAEDQVLVPAGERIPVDGVVITGRSSVDTALITGEPVPIAVGECDSVFAGSLNIDAPLTVRAQSSGGASRIAQILRRSAELGGERAPIIALTDRLSTLFLFAVLLFAVVGAVYWIPHSYEQAVNCVVAFLIVSCPCALGLATPAALSIALSRAARCGILIKDEYALEKLTRTKHFFFDKTGTLTKGICTVKELFLTQETSLRYEASIIQALTGKALTHPLSASIHHYLAAQQVESKKLPRITIVGGRGVEGIDSEGILYRIGSERWLRELGIIIPEELARKASQAQVHGLTTVLYAKGGVCAALFVMQDQIAQGSAELIAKIRSQGGKVTILSGDTQAAVDFVADILGIAKGDAFGALLPEDKECAVQKSRRPNVFIGDGVNDALAMKGADLAISLRGALEASVDVAQIIILRGGIKNVRHAYEGAKRVMRTIRTTLLLSACYNVIAGALALAGYINPLLAALVMPLSSASVVTIVFFSKSFYETADTRSFNAKEDA